MSSTQHQELKGKGSRAERRKNYLINPAFQWKYTLLMLLGLFVVSSFSAITLFGALHQQARARILNPQVIHQWENTWTIVFSCGAFSIVTMIALGVWNIVITHRMCGPLFVIQRYLDELAGGRIPTLRPLRRKDEFKELYASFGRAVKLLRSNTQSEMQILDDLLALARSAAGNDPKRRKQVIASMENHLRELRGRCSSALGTESLHAPGDEPADAIELVEAADPVPVSSV
jgi:hypothetical protein